MAVLGRLLIELAANTARLQGDMGKAVSIAETAAAKIKTAFKFAGGGLIGAALVNTVKQSIEFGDSISKAASKAGLGAKSMSELAYAAKLADVDIGALSTGIKKMQVAISEAGTGAKGPTLALQALGLTVGDLQRRRPDAQFELLAQRISELKDPADRARAATELFGKAGADLLPLFEQGAAGIAKARAEAQKLGLSFSDEQISKLAAADDSIKRLDASWKAFATTLTARVAGPLSTVLDRLSGMDTRSTERKIQDLNEMLARPPVGLEALGQGGRRAEQEAELRALLARREMERVKQEQTGTFGGPLGRRAFASPLGYAAAAAHEEAEKAAAAEKKAREKQSRDVVAIMRRQNEDVAEDSKKRLDDDIANTWQAAKEKAEAISEFDRAHKRWLDEQQNKMSDNAKFFRSTMLTAFDDWIHGGKLKFDELIKYMMVRWAVSGITKLIDNALTTKGADKKSGWGGVLSTVGQVLGSMYGGGRAKGGNVQAGKIYKVNENTPRSEWFAPGMDGAIIPAGAFAGGGGTHVTVNNYMDNRGASLELQRRLPAILEANNRKVTADIIEGIQRRRYRITNN